MKRCSLLLCVVWVVFLISIGSFGLEITEFSKGGWITWTNDQPGTTCHVEWASSLTGEWYRSFSFMSTGEVASSEVPVYFRIVRSQPADTTPPANISSFTATAGDGQVSLSWDNPLDSDFQGVKILRKTGSYPTSPTDGTTIYNGTGTSKTDTGLANGTPYYYRAFSYDEVPNFSPGATATATPVAPDTTPPANIYSFSTTAGDTQVSLSWVNPGDADIQGVKIQRKTGSYPTSPTDGTTVYNGTGTATTDTGLENGTPYYYKAFSYDEVPNYSSGATATVTPLKSVPAGMVLIPAGSFQMGDPYIEGHSDELPLHTVNVSEFCMAKYEVTYAEMREVLQWGYNNNRIVISLSTTPESGSITPAAPGVGQLLSFGVHQGMSSDLRYSAGTFSVVAGRENFPCNYVTWLGAAVYCNMRSEKEGLQPCYNFGDWSNDHITMDMTKNGYRLPTEAEWEKAARGGLVGHHFPWDSNHGGFAEHINGSKANYNNSGDPYSNLATPVGYYNGLQTPAGVDMANGYGLYDMAGNVQEWCWDPYENTWYTNANAVASDTTGPVPKKTSGNRVIRGGYYSVWSFFLRCSERYGTSGIDISRGFRCVRRP